MKGTQDVWLLETARGVLNRFTFGRATRFMPIWSPDAGRIAFSAWRNGTYDLYQKSASGAGDEELVLADSSIKHPTDWSMDGRFLLYRSTVEGNQPGQGFDLWALPLNGDRQPIAVARTRFDERDGQFSPDGKWVAFQSDESGRVEIYVQPFPGPGRKERVSTTGGAQVRWRGDGRELFYIGLDRRLMSVQIRTIVEGRDIETAAPVPLFATHIGGAVEGIIRQQYMVSADGQRFLMNNVVEQANTPLTVVLNWKAKR